MKTILLATGNQRKITEASNILKKYDIEVEAIKLEIEEIQDSEPKQIVISKAIKAYELAKKPVVVSDTSWNIPALGGFPGGYMKDIAAWLSPEDWQNLMANHQDKTIYCLEHVAYFDGHKVKHFLQTYKGKFINQIRGKIEPHESFEASVILYGDKTMAEYLEAGELASAGEDLGHWKQFGEWYRAKA